MRIATREDENERVKATAVIESILDRNQTDWEKVDDAVFKIAYIDGLVGWFFRYSLKLRSLNLLSYDPYLCGFLAVSLNRKIDHKWCIVRLCLAFPFSPLNSLLLLSLLVIQELELDIICVSKNGAIFVTINKVKLINQ